MFISFIVSVIGFSIICRQFRIVCAEFSLHPSFRFGVYLLSAVLSILFYAFKHQSPIVLWLFFGIFFGTLKFFAFFLRTYAEKCLEERIPMMLDSVLVGMSAGRSLRQSITSAVSAERTWLNSHWKEIARNLELESSELKLKSRTSSGFCALLKQIYVSNNRQKEQLLFLRKQYATRNNFRRRSGQLLTHLRWQTFIMVIMYICLLIFVVTNFGYAENSGALFLSHLLFAAGLICAFFIQKGVKWNI